jgi:O-antigen ligase
MKTATLPDRIALAALVLLLILPFANPIHTAPIPSFYSEWLAAALAIVMIAAALVGCASNGRPLAIPEVVALPLLFAIAAMVQAATGHAAHPRQALLTASVLLLSGAMMIAGRSMTEAGGLKRLAPKLARFLIAGSLLQCLVLGMQAAHIAIPWLVFLPAPGAAAAGLLGQTNHLADYLWMGVASAIYLMARKGQISLSGSLLVLCIAVPSTLAASRSVMLYPIGLALLALLAWRSTRNTRPWRQVALLCLATLPLMLAADRLQVFRGEDTSTTTTRSLTERLAASGGDRIRRGLYQVALEEAMTRPLTGHGIGATQWTTFQRADRWPEGSSPVVAEHTHNLVLQYLLEYGLPLTVVALILLLRWLRLALPGTGDANRWWALGLLTVIGIHSQFEYPMWLVYFLLPTCWLVGALNQSRTLYVQLHPRHAAVTGICLVTASITMASLLGDYRRLELLAAASAPGLDSRILQLGFEAGISLEQDSLLAPQAIVMMVGAMGISRKDAAEKQMLCQQALRISPTRDVAQKCTAISAIQGERGEATRLMRLTLATYGENPSWRRLQAEFYELANLEGNP